MSKIKDLISLKGCYSAHDVGEKELILDYEKILKILWDDNLARWTTSDFEHFKTRFKIENIILKNDLKETTKKEKKE